MKFTAPAALLFLAASLAFATEAPAADNGVVAPVEVRAAAQVEQDLPVKRAEDVNLEKRKGGKGGGKGGSSGDGDDEDAASTHAISFAALAAAVGAAAFAA